MTDSFKISTFVSEFDKLGGPLSANLFSVELPIPTKIGSVEQGRTLSLLADGFSPPGFTMATDDSVQPYGYGPTRRYVWGAAFTELQMDFIVDAKASVIATIRDWMDYIIHFNTKEPVTTATGKGQPFFVAYRDNYTTDIVTYVHDAVGRKVIKTTYFDAFPYRSTQSAFNNSSQNTYTKLSVVFSFSRFHEEILGLDEQASANLTTARQNVAVALDQAQAPITQQQSINLNSAMVVALEPLSNPLPPLMPSNSVPDEQLLHTGGAWGMTSQLPLSDPDFDTDSLFT